MNTEDVQGVPGTYRHYVYTLAYPDGRVFYVGKGVGNRINAHEQEARSGVQSQKCAIIRGIWEQGSEVVKTQVAYFASDEEATRYERSLMSSLDDLTNVQGGTDQFTSVTITPEDQSKFGASIRRVYPNGQEYWGAREVANYLGYASWASFQKVIAKAEKALVTVGIDPSQDFHHTVLAVLIGHDASRDLADVHLSRIGFLLAVQSADPAKSMVAYGKTYIAQQMLRDTAAEFTLRPVEESLLRPLVSYRARQKLRQAEEQNHD